MSELWYAAFALTLLVELPVWTVVGRWATGVPIGRCLAVGAVVNAISHPLLWFVLIPLLDAATDSTLVATVLAEALVVALEAALARWLLPTGWVTAACVAALANSLSLGVGLVWHAMT